MQTTTRPAWQRQLSPVQVRSIIQADHRINLWTGAIRSGKTISSLLAFLLWLDSEECPKSGVVFMVGQTQQTIERNILEPLQDPTVFGALTQFVHHTPGANVANIMGRTVALVGATDVKAFKRIRGATAAGAYVDEVSLLPAHFLTELLGRMSLDGAKLFGTTNPDGPAHWLKREFIDRPDHFNRDPETGAVVAGFRHFTFTLDDNPSLSANYVRSIKAEHVGLWYQRLILGKWVAAEGIVYDAWNPERHVVKVLPRIDRWFSLGVDYGTTNPLDAVTIGRGRDADGVTRLYVGAEHRWDPKVAKVRLTDAQHSQRLREWLQQHPREDGNVVELGIKPDFLCVDPSAASFIEQLMHDRVGNVTPAVNDVLDGIRTVSSLMAADRLRVHESCKPLIEELASYSWDDKATEAGLDKPMKVADHAADALRYAVHTTESLWRPHVGLRAA